MNEQRVTGILAHVLVGCTVFMTPIFRVWEPLLEASLGRGRVLKLVPMPVLLGVFLYMGIVSMAGQQFVQRILILFMPQKYQPGLPLSI